MGRVTVREALAAAVGFVVLTVAMTWPLVRHAAHDLPSDAIDPLLNAWILAWAADRIPHGLSGWWNAPFLFPAHDTLGYSEHLLGIAMFTAPVQWLTGNAVLAYNLAFLGSYVLAGTSMYCLTRSFGVEKAAAALAALTFAFAPYRIAQVSHLQVLLSGWMALGLWGLHRFLWTGSRRALAGFAAAFLATGLSNGYFLFFFSLPAVVLVIGALIRPRLPRTRIAADLALTVVVLAAVLAPIIAGYHRVRVEQGLARSRDVIDMFGATPTSYLHRPLSAWLWAHVLEVGDAERELFPGAVAITLAGVALVAAALQHARAGRSRVVSTLPIGAYASIVGLAFWLSLGTGRNVTPRFAWVAGLPYTTLLGLVPGLDGLRVPARMFTVVSLGVSVLASAGAAVLLGPLSTMTRAIVVAVLAITAIAEGHGGSMPLAPAEMPAMAESTELYRWLRDQPPGAVVELPIGNTNPITLQYQMKILLHRHPIVNGYSGWQTELQGFLAGDASPFVDADSIDGGLDGLRAIGVRFVIIHPRAYEDVREAAAVMRVLRAARSVAGAERSFGDAHVFTLPAWDEAPPNDEPARRLASSLLRATASHAPERLWMAFDGDLETRWLTGQPQRGGEWIQLEFDRAREIARVEITINDRSLGDYPRSIVVEGSDGTQPRKTLYVGTPLVSILRTLAAPRRLPSISIPLPPGKVRWLQLLQTGRTSSWYWSVDEMGVFERVGR